MYTSIALIRSLTFPLEDTFVKQIFSDDYLYPANIQFDRGLLEMIILLIITPILWFSFGLKLDFISENVHIIIIITMIFYTLAAFVKAFILLKIIYHYSSQSVSFLLLSELFGGYIIRGIEIISFEAIG